MLILLLTERYSAILIAERLVQTAVVSTALTLSKTECRWHRYYAGKFRARPLCPKKLHYDDFHAKFLYTILYKKLAIKVGMIIEKFYFLKPYCQ